MSRKKEAKARQITRQLIGIDEITDSGLQTSHGRLPVPGKTAVHWLHYSPHVFGLPM